MRNKQLGVSLSGLLMVAVILIMVALLGLKLAPSYLEFFAIKKAVVAIAGERKGSVAEVRKAFDARTVIDDIATVKGADLEIAKEGNEFVIAANYRKEIRLFGNIGIHIDFSATSKQ